MINSQEQLKEHLYNDLRLSPMPNDRYKIQRDFLYKDVLVPKGYTTNGANIPRLFWSIFPPNRSNYMPAAVVHDYLCDKEQYDKADEYFKEILKTLGLSKFVVTVFSSSVKLYHKIRYRIL
jgi:hypothetical protein